VKNFQHIQKAGYLVLKLFGGTRTQSECVELMTSHIILHGPAVAEVNFLSGKVFQLDPKKMKFRDRWPACILFEDFVCVLQVLKSPIFRVGLKCNRVFLKINTSPMGDTDVFLDKPIGKQFFEEVASSTINNYRRIRNDPDFWFGKIFSGKSMRDGMFQYMLENGIPQIAVAYYMNHFYDGNGCIPGKSSNMEHYIMDPLKHEVRQRLALFVSMGPMPYPKDDKTFAKLLKQAMSSARPGVPANGILNPVFRRFPHAFAAGTKYMTRQQQTFHLKASSKVDESFHFDSCAENNRNPFQPDTKVTSKVGTGSAQPPNHASPPGNHSYLSFKHDSDFSGNPFMTKETSKATTGFNTQPNRASLLGNQSFSSIKNDGHSKEQISQHGNPFEIYVDSSMSIINLVSDSSSNGMRSLPTNMISLALDSTRTSDSSYAQTITSSTDDICTKAADAPITPVKPPPVHQQSLANTTGLWPNLPSNVNFTPPRKGNDATPPPSEELSRHKQQVARTRAQWQWCASRFRMQQVQHQLQPVVPPQTVVPTMYQARQYLANLINPDFHACDHLCPTFGMYTHCPVLMQHYAAGHPIFLLGDNQKIAVFEGKFYSFA